VSREQGPAQPPTRAVLDRANGTARVRRITGAALAVATALAGVFAGLAASATHSRKSSAGASGSVDDSKVVLPAPHVAAPSARAPGSAAAATPPPLETPSPPASAAAPPVVVSGGS
jgi:hypothetical protein